MCHTTFYLLSELFIMALLFSFRFPIPQKWEQLPIAKGVDTYTFIHVHIITCQSLGQIWCYIQLMTL